jgi:Protein of unknown function (DUF3987)
MDMSDRADLDLAQAAEDEATSTLLPLEASAEAPTPFPVDALGSVLKPAALAIHDRTQAPLAICGQSVLAAACLAVQPHVNVILPSGQTRPASCFFVTVAGSGERKTTCDNFALGPVTKWLTERRFAIAAAVKSSRKERQLWTSQHDAIIEKAKATGATDDAVQVELERLGAEPASPQVQHVICKEPTIEGLVKVLKGELGFAGIYTSEAGAFLGGHAMSKDNRLKTAASLSDLWDGEPINRIRGTDELMTLYGRRLSAHLMMQPGVATNLLGDPTLKDQGLLSRFLVSAPAPAAGTRLWREPKAASAADLERYTAQLMAILNKPMSYADGSPGELQPRNLPLSHEARAVWISYHDAVEPQLGPGGQLETISGFAAKLPEHACRLAVVLAVLDDFHTFDVSGEHMAHGIALAEHYCGEALRLFGQSQVNREQEQCHKMLNFIRKQDGPVSLRLIGQEGPYGLRKRDAALPVISMLEKSGTIKRVESAVMVEGIRTEQAWVAVRGAANEN